MKTQDLIALADREIELITGDIRAPGSPHATVAVIRALRDKVKAQDDKLRAGGMNGDAPADKPRATM